MTRVIGVSLALILSGCGEQAEPAHNPAEMDTAHFPAFSPPAQQAKSLLIFAPVSSRNPFAPHQTATRSGPHWQFEGCKQDSSEAPLQQHELSQLSMRGVLKNTQITKAVVQTPEGQLYLVATGDRMGRQGGVVTAIHHDHIALKERVQRGQQCLQQNTELLLHGAGLRSESYE